MFDRRDRSGNRRDRSFEYQDAPFNRPAQPSFDRPARGGFGAAEVTHHSVRATVKWYNSTKGFGFVSPEDGTPDAFLHASALQAAGHDAISDGTTIVCDLSRGPKGPQVAAIHSVDASTATPSSRPPRAPREERSGGFGGPAAGDGETVEGSVKWFNEAKGFGFIAPSNGGKDIFVHANALNRSGVQGLAEGDEVRVTVKQGMKGPEAERIELI
ncbi:MAG: cold shock domain-containing protein [Azospirillaceae bacterium]|nr:cold shock domain-containing protein [Azospirillaceae bacterium]